MPDFRRSTSEITFAAGAAVFMGVDEVSEEEEWWSCLVVSLMVPSPYLLLLPPPPLY